MDDNKVLEILITDKGRINTHYKQIVQKDSFLHEYLMNKYTDSGSLLETIYRIQHTINVRPVCKCCGLPVQFATGYGFRDFCSKKCSKEYINDNVISNINDDTIRNDYIINDYIIKDYINNNKLQKKYIIEHGYEDYLLNRYSDSESIRETIYRICYNVENKPICKQCGLPVQFKGIDKGFSLYCSSKCEKLFNVPDITKEFIDSLSVKGDIYKKDNVYYEKIKEFLQNTFGDEYRDYKESLYMLKNNIQKVPECPVCSKKVNYVNNRNIGVSRFTKYCSTECNRLDVINQTIEEYKRQSGYDIMYDEDTDSYIFKNVCDVHSEFSIKRMKAHNRCGYGRIKYMQICPICNPERNKETSIENIVKQMLDKLKVEYVQHDRTVISPKELDFYIPSYEIAIECNGIYWHSDAKKPNDYSYNKYLKCKEKRIQLITLWEDDIINNSGYIFDYLQSIFLQNTNMQEKYTLRKIFKNTIENCSFFSKYIQNIDEIYEIFDNEYRCAVINKNNDVIQVLPLKIVNMQMLVNLFKDSICKVQLFNDLPILSYNILYKNTEYIHNFISYQHNVCYSSGITEYIVK